MPDATLSQGHRLIELILRENDPHTFVQSLHSNWGAVQRIGRGQLTQASLATSEPANPYAGEKTRPGLSYPKGYKPNSVRRQVEVLRERLGGLDDQHVASLAAVWRQFKQADGLYVVPKPTWLAARFGISCWQEFGVLTEQYPLAALEAQRPFRNWRKGELGSDRCRLLESAKTALEQLEAQQPGDFLVFPAQTGKLWAGYSMRNARWEIEHASPAQWPLPAYCVGWMLFANPHRIEKYGHLCIDCPGDEYRAGASDEFDYCPYFYWDGGLHFRISWIDGVHDRFGSASAFR